MHYIDLPLDEDYPFRVTSSAVPVSKGYRLEVPVYGNAVIAVAARDDWWMHKLTLTASNGKCGKDCDTWEQEVCEGEPLFEPIRAYVENFCRERVEAEIAAYFTELAEQQLDYRLEAMRERRDAAE